MKINAYLLFSSLLYLLSFNTHAERELKHFNVGVGGSFLNITDDDNSSTDIDFSGSSFSLQYAFTDQVAVRAEAYSLEQENFSAIEINGAAVSLLIGIGLATEGVKVYVGGGVFTETVDFVLSEEDLTGLQATAGVGYNWDIAAVDVAVGVREPSEYEDLGFDEPIVVTITATFSIRL